MSKWARIPRDCSGGTEFCRKEAELSVAYFLKDLGENKQQKVLALPSCSPHFSFYTASVVLQRGEAGQSHFQESGENHSYSFTSSFHLWPFHSFINGEGVLPRAGSKGSAALGANRPHLLLAHRTPTYSSKGDGDVLANSEHARAAEHPMPCSLGSSSALTWSCCLLSSGFPTGTS